MLPQLLNNHSNANFFLLAGPCVIENEQMPFDIAERISKICANLEIPFVFKASYRKANR
ncbi:MAG: 3-deoxy-8-phosphooctulonate synthase, partial [Bacteroidales bacterium]|nr:3-deoxy-8-phosphooctulonate synthase [Bacteroidales bacterium]